MAIYRESLKAKLKQFARWVPLLRTLLAERDDLRSKNSELTRELERSRAKFMEAWHQREDVWVPPGHFYSPIASFSELKVDEEEIFEVPPAIRGVDLNEGGQLAFLKELAAFYPEQPFTAEAVPGRRYLFENPNYS